MNLKKSIDQTIRIFAYFSCHGKMFCIIYSTKRIIHVWEILFYYVYDYITIIKDLEKFKAKIFMNLVCAS
jgi:hypothetical protein